MATSLLLLCKSPNIHAARYAQVVREQQWIKEAQRADPLDAQGLVEEGDGGVQLLNLQVGRLVRRRCHVRWLWHSDEPQPGRASTVQQQSAARMSQASAKPGALWGRTGALVQGTA